MKKLFKQKSGALAVPEIDSAVGALIDKVQQRLVVLENKIDILISRYPERKFENKRNFKSFQNFDQSNRYGKQKQDNRYGGRNFNQAVCAECGKECEVPFKPEGGRPVYCKECFSRRKYGGSFKEDFSRKDSQERFTQGRYLDKQQSGEDRKFGRNKKRVFRKRK